MEATEVGKEIGVDAHNASNTYPNTFPAAFVEYCTQNALSPTLFQKIIKLTNTLPRYVRVHRAWWDYFRQNTDNTTYVKYSRYISEQELQTLRTLHEPNEAKKIEIMQVMLAEELHLSLDEVKHVSWLPYCHCFALPANVSLHSSHMYQVGFIIGMDAASMAAVLALQPRHGDMVLDVCCAPGMKLNLIADMIRGNANAKIDHWQKAVLSVQSQEIQQHKATIVESTLEEQKAKKSNSYNVVNAGVVIGVDANLDRLYTCRSIVRKHENAYKISVPKTISMCSDNETVSFTWNDNYCANVNYTNVALFLADGCTFTLPTALQTLLVTSQEREFQCEEHVRKTQCAVIHDNTGLTSHEERKLNKLKTINSDYNKTNNTSSEKTTNSNNYNKRERVSHCIKSDTSIINSNCAKCILPEREREKTKVHVVYAPKSVREHLINLEQSLKAKPSLSSSSSCMEQKLCQTTELLFDKVLVDAECTHDGSLRHLCLGSPLPKSKNAQDNISLVNKQTDACTGVSNTHRMAHIHINNANENSKITHITNVNEEDHIKYVKEETSLQEEVKQNKFYLKKEEMIRTSPHMSSDKKLITNNENTCSDLFALQLGLLRNGFAQLKVNGTLVYCTCSFAYAQDENVVLHFIKEYNANSSHSHLKAVLVPPFSFPHNANETCNKDGDNCINHNNTLIPFLKVYDALQCTLNECKDYCHAVRDGAKLCEKLEATENNNISQNDICQEHKESTIDNDNNKSVNGDDSMNANSKEQNVYVGSRFWPHLFHTSFQYVTKIMKVKV